MKFLYSLMVVAVAIVGASALDDSIAQAKCRSLHHVDADDAGTGYTNNNCLLNCNIHGRIYSHPVNEGQTCLFGSSPHACHNGQCVSQGRRGHIDIEVVSASLSQAANAYATVCIQNSTTQMSLPIKDRSQCVSCSTNTIYSSYPTWNSVCAGSGKYQFVEESRVTVEVWNHIAQGNNVFLGGASLTIPQMLGHGDNHRVIHLALTGGSMAGQVNTRITWTQIN